jgi:PAS domain S-box-containing protein
MKIKSKKLILQMKNIHVTYDSVRALKGIDFDLYHGEIHALIGEHRAGKSSLVKILSGAVKKREGEIIFNGKKVNYFTPKTATKAGIGMVYQNLNIIPNLNAVKNIFAGQMIKRRWGFINESAMRIKTVELFKQLKLKINLDVPIYRLTREQQYMVELTRILMMDPKLIILDELSNKLTPEEMKVVYHIIYEKKKQGKSIIYISHDMDEILELAERVTILKDGYRRGTEYVKDLDKYRLFQLTYSFALSKEEFQKEEKQLLFLKRYLENIIQYLPVGIIILNHAGKIQLTNYAALDILKQSHDNIINKSINTIIKGMDHKIAQSIIQKVKDKREGTWEEVSMRDKALVRIDVFPLKDPDYKLLGTILLIQDVSMNRYLKNYFIESEKMASVAELAVGVAHEINNPLYIIKNYFELIHDKQLEPSIKADLNEIEKEVDRIVEIVSSLLSFSRIKEFPEKNINLFSILEEVLLLLHHALSKKNIKLEKKILNKNAEIVGDENRLKQLFINLLNNSIEAVLEEGIIQVELKKNLNNINVIISDNGYGIPKSVSEKIFNPFFSTKINKKNTGLGLSICQRIVKEHRGDIRFASIPGQKTSFFIEFPVK